MSRWAEIARPSRAAFYVLIVVAVLSGLVGMNFLKYQSIQALVVTAIINGIIAAFF
jgi:hypothetical protein